MQLIGIAGRAGSGKDPAAQVVTAFMPGRTVIMPLATGLKSMLAGYYQIAPDAALLYTAEGKSSPAPRPLRLGNTVRSDLQQLGDVTRAINPGIWIDDAILRASRLGAEFLILPDVRYKNELAVCHFAFWIGPDAPGDHATEAELTSADVEEEFRFMQPTVSERLAALRMALIAQAMGAKL